MDDEVCSVENVAVFSNGKIAVVGKSHDFKPNIYIYDDLSFNQIETQESNEAKLVSPCDVAVTTNDVLVIADCSKYLKCYQYDGRYVRSICTLLSPENPDIEVNITNVAVSSQGHICACDSKRKCITIHHETDKSFYKCIKTNIVWPKYLAISSRNMILVSGGYGDQRVESYDMSGKQLFSINTWQVWGRASWPEGLACDSGGNIYIAVTNGGEYAGDNPGHIHVYNDQGDYLQCILSVGAGINGLYQPCGLAWQNHALYVSDRSHAVKIYSKV